MVNAAPASIGSDARIIAWIGTAHGLSHFFQMMLPPLIPVLKDEFGLSYAALGLVTGVYFAVSGLMQTVAGFAVDRYGPRASLIFGLVVSSIALLVYALAPSYLALLAGAVIGGIGNSMFHPADMALLNARITPARLGPAFSMHTVGGYTGFIVGPLFVVGMAGAIGWRWAIAAAGIIGLLFTLAFLVERRLGGAPAAPRDRHAAQARAGVALLASPAVLSCFAFYFLLAISSVTFLTFAPTVVAKLYDVPLVAAAAVLTAYFVGSIAGTLAGGIGAARSGDHGALVAACLACAVVGLAFLASGSLPASLVWIPAAGAGFAFGFSNPSRDIMVRQVTPEHARGKVYGFVYAGMDAGSAIAPWPLGWLLDHGHAGAVFAVAACAVLASLPTVLVLRRASPARYRAGTT